MRGDWMMRLRQLECFVRTCELGSISRAAEQLRIAQPALGLQIRNLEHDFGVTLLVRSSRGVTPTPAGELLLDWARDVIARTRDVKAQLREAAKQDVDHLTLGLSPSVTNLLAGAILEEAARRASGLELRIVEGLSHVLIEEILAERIDLALVTGAIDRRGLERTPVLEERLFWIAPPGETRRDIRLVDALALPLAMPGESDALRAIVEAAAAERGLEVAVTYEIASIAAIKDLVRRGMAHAILPHGAARREVEAGELAALPIIDPDLLRTLSIFRREGRNIGRHERVLVDVLRDALATLVAEASELADVYRLV
jgi:LysR family nitrogen assimilation transcriptional regulator